MLYLSKIIFGVEQESSNIMHHFSARSTLIAYLLCVIPFLGAFVPALRASDSLPITIDTSKTVTSSGTFQGFGIQDTGAQLWHCGGNPALTPALAQGAYDDYFAPRLQAMKPAFVRMVIDMHDFAPTAPDTNNILHYDFSNAYMEGRYHDLQALQSENSAVLLTIQSVPDWLGSDTIPPTPSAAGTYYQFPADGTIQGNSRNDLWAYALTGLLQHLFGTDGSGFHFTNIVGLGAPDELGYVNQAQPTSVTFPQIDAAYSALAHDLSAAQLPVHLYGPDYFGPDGVTAIATAQHDTALNPLLQFYDYHDYETVASGAPVSPPFVTTAMNAVAAGSDKPVWLTEMNDTRNQTTTNWTLLPTMAIDSLNTGLAGVSLWDLQDECINTQQNWGVLDTAAQHFAPKTTYYAWSMVTAHTAANSRVYATSCGIQSCPNVRIAALNDQHGHDTILAYNLTSSAPQTLTLTYANQSPTETLYRYLMSPTNLPNPALAGNSVGYDETISLHQGTFTDTIPAGAFAVYSSLNPQAPNSIMNGGFEADGGAIHSPMGWTTWPGSAGTDGDASYTQANGHSSGFTGVHWKASPYQVSTYQTITGLSATTSYVVSAWVQSSGSQIAQLNVWDQAGGVKLQTLNISGAANGTWTHVTIPGVVPVNGHLMIEVYSQASAQQWVLFDDIQLQPQS